METSHYVAGSIAAGSLCSEATPRAGGCGAHRASGLVSPAGKSTLGAKASPGCRAPGTACALRGGRSWAGRGARAGVCGVQPPGEGAVGGRASVRGPFPRPSSVGANSNELIVGRVCGGGGAGLALRSREPGAPVSSLCADVCARLISLPALPCFPLKGVISDNAKTCFRSVKIL